MDVIELSADPHNMIDNDKITSDWINRISREYKTGTLIKYW
jgi:hypothetical protein